MQTNRLQITKLIMSMRFYPNSPITEASVETVIDSFEDTLADLPFDAVEAAVKQYKSTETFFPTPGKLRELAMDLQMIALGVPSPAEAWGMVLTAEKHVESVWCEFGAQLRDEAINWTITQDEYYLHMDNCDICVLGGFREVYSHPVVAETVKVLGGRDVIITDNPTADRARFIDAYREIVARERRKAAMLPDVKAYISDTRNNMLEAGNQIKQLAKGMTK